ncbi:MAG: hypothetical protein ABSA14_12255 [Acidimicrobiales bacterium]
MNLKDEFEVPLTLAETWATLTDIEKITTVTGPTLTFTTPWYLSPATSRSHIPGR